MSLEIEASEYVIREKMIQNEKKKEDGAWMCDACPHGYMPKQRSIIECMRDAIVLMIRFLMMFFAVLLR